MLRLQWGTCKETGEWWLRRFAVPLAMVMMIIMTPTILISIAIIITITRIITHTVSYQYIPLCQICQGTSYHTLQPTHVVVVVLDRMHGPGTTAWMLRAPHRGSELLLTVRGHWRVLFVCWTCFSVASKEYGELLKQQILGWDWMWLNCNTFNSIRIFYIFLQASNRRLGWTTRPKRRSWMKQALLTDGWRNRNLKRSSFIGGMKGAWMSTNKLIKPYAITNCYS